MMGDGVWYLDKFDRHECCDCSKIHETEWKIENGRIFTRWRANERETKRLRKKYGIKVTRAKSE